MRIKKLLISIFIGCFCSVAFGQKSVKDSAIFIPHISVVYGIQFPGGDLVSRFGYFHNIGAAFQIKDRKNWIFGGDFGIQFTDQVKENTISNLVTAEGVVLNVDGEASTIKIGMRGISFSGKFGKLFPVLGPNKNSGPIISVGLGFWQHRIRVEDTQQKTPQIEGDYQQGYDRKSNGVYLSQFVGYQLFNNSKLLNFYVGAELWQGFLQNKRNYNFNEYKSDTEPRFDSSFGFKFGWVIPLYKKAPREYYFD